MKESLKVVTADGTALAATHFIPEKSNDRVVLINSATGVRQRYYGDFATYLKNEGFHVYTYDYRGVGESRPKKLRGFKASMYDWGARDYHGMLMNIFQTHRQAKVYVIGHSIGGQVTGLSPLTSRVEAVVMVGAQTPYWKNFKGFPLQAKLYFFWFMLIPFFTKLAGYFPASKLGLFEDLPHDVARQWARWAATEQYLFEEFPADKERFASLSNHGLMISFTDDKIAPPLAVRDLMRHYPQMRWTHWELKPDDLMTNRVGHFGFFRKHMLATLWKDTLDWIMKPSLMKANKAA